MTISDLIVKALELKDFVSAEEKEVDARLKPYKDGIVAIEQEILRQLQEQGVQNFKTEFGTAYQASQLSVKVDNPGDFRQFVVGGDIFNEFGDFVETAAPHWEFADLRCLKEPVKDWLDQNHGVTPPGVRVEQFVKCNIRRS